jgi:hypothetical protein
LASEIDRGNVAAKRADRVKETESQNDAELQRRGWQTILDNFPRHVEAKDVAGTAGK